MTKTVQGALYSLYSWNDATKRSAPMSPAATPTFSPAAGTYSTAQSVTITSSPGTTILYTTDGNAPVMGSPPYTGPITVNVSETIKAIAYGTGYTLSAVGSAAYTISVAAAATPTFSPAAGTYATSQTVSISCSTPSSTIYYTTDGTTPTTSSSVYTTALTVSASEVINAIATATGYAQSSVGSAAYTIGSVQGTYLAAGHWITKQPLRLVYPRPDTETNTWARHHYAYWDGTTGLNYRIPITVDFGGYPYLYQLISAPAGMSIVLPNTGAGHSPPYPDAYVTWTPTGVVTNQTVKVRVFSQDYQNDPTQYVDVIWTVSTSSTVFVFIDAVNGNDTTGTGAISAPWKTFTKAFGTTIGQTINSNKICYARTSGATPYSVPVQASQSGTSYYVLNTTKGPSALIGYPGDVLPVFNLSSAAIAAGTNWSGVGDDLFIQDINFDGYQSTTSHSRLFWGTGKRMVFDSLVQTNAGIGTTGGSNDSGIFIDGVSQYVTINNCSQSFNSSQVGNTGNNVYGIFSCYNATELAAHGNYINQSTLSLAAVCYAKSDSSNVSIRGNVAITNGSGFMFSFGQAVTNPPNMNNNESCYNLAINGEAILLPAGPLFTEGNLWAYRNNIVGSKGIWSWEPGYNLVAPAQLAPSTATTGGTLAAQTYYAKLTVLGVSGESLPSAEKSITTTGTTSTITYSWSAMPGVTGYNLYIGTTAGGENIVINVGNVTSYTYTGSGGAAGTPPAVNTAVSSARFEFDSNVVQTAQTGLPQTGAAMNNDIYNQIASSGLINTTTGLQIATPSGTVGAEIQ